MKILTLLRHAKSTWDDPVARDFDRPLNKRGRKAAQTIGREMRAQGLEFDEVIASPAVRVVETLDEVSEGYGALLDIDYDKRLYLAPVSTLLEVIRDADDEAERLLIVGHNPGLENLALALTREGPLRAEVAIKYPTGTVAEISLPIENWVDIDEGTGTLTRFIRPRDLDPELGPDEDS
ncbi:MAG TPA: histidine phosphatase family protein [Allosphingosinicella sp.]|uniref:SixA phosphatase family protein n=1 Tax=Allosphingosinicella sp. TaxID=2823234 RepID=UPI002ED8E150